MEMEPGTSFFRTFFLSKPVRVVFGFCLGVLVLSRLPAVQQARLFMPFSEIMKRFPGLPRLPQQRPQEQVMPGSQTNVLFNPAAGGEAQGRRALDNFFKALRRTRKRQKPALVRVLHYGDSILWGDNLTRRVRSRLEQAFGKGGRGVVPVFYPTPAYQLQRVEQTFSRAWDVDYLRTTQPVPVSLGLTLHSFRARRGAMTEFRLPPGDGVYRLGLLYEGDLDVRITLALTNGTQTNPVPRQLSPGYAVVESSVPFQEGTIRAAPGTLLHGYNLEARQGVVYSPVIRKGVFARDFAMLTRDLFVRQVRQVRPHLVVFQFGKNECAWRHFDLEKHLAGVEHFISMVREAVPGVSILLLGPGGRIRRSTGQVFPNIKRIIKGQRELALRYNAAFYNTMEALGGERAFFNLIRRGLVMRDYVHLTVKGGDMLGSRLFSNLMAAYRSYLARSKGGQGRGLLTYFSQAPKPTGSQKEIKQASSAVIFDTVAFWFFFLIVFFLFWMLYKAGMVRLLMLLVASYYFYMSWNPVFIVLIVISTLVDYGAGFAIHRARRNQQRARAGFFLFLSLVANLGLLFFFKYFNLFADFVNQLGVVDGRISFVSLILPVGISFYTFQTMSYSLDIHAGKLEPVRSLPRFALFVSFFPQLVAGPIVRAREFLPQLEKKPVFNERQILAGMFLILVGLFKKVVLSDYIAVNFVDRVFAAPEMYSGLENLFGVYAYGLQIYCDFSGYSDIAIGAAAMLGFTLPLNFNSPYKAHNLQDFWHRWHISLSTWLRDYLYIPLGGNRKGRVRTYINLMLTMILGGLWHGAAYKFILWGAIHGIGLAVVRLIQRVRRQTSPRTWWGRALGMVLTFHFVSFAWIFFRAQNMDVAGKILGQIAGLTTHLPNLTFTIALVLFGGYFLHLVPNRIFTWTKERFIRLPALVQVLVLLMFAILFYKTAVSEAVPFIYFQF